MAIAIGVFTAIAIAFVLIWRVKSADGADRFLDAVARLPHRKIEARIAGWPYRPFARKNIVNRPAMSVERGTTTPPLPKNGREKTPEYLHQSGLEDLLTAHDDAAVELLVRAAEGEPRNARYWSDVAAARIARAQDSGDVSELADALAAADRALRLDTLLTAAAFNRALTLQLLNLDVAAAKEYSSMLANEPADSGWSAEAMARLASLRHERRDSAWSRNRQRIASASSVGDSIAVDQIVSNFRQEARTSSEVQVMNDWAVATLGNDDASAAMALLVARQVADSLIRLRGDGLLRDSVSTVEEASSDPDRTQMLARAYRAYYDARVAYAKRDVMQSIPLFESAVAMFTKAGSPMHRVAAYYLASAHFDANETEQAEQKLRALSANVPPQHRALKAQIAWELGILSGNRGLPEAELRYLEEALRGFEDLGEFDNTASMRASVAVILGRLGLDSEAWKLRRRAFASASESGDPARLQVAVIGAAHEALATQRWDVARSLFSIAIESPNQNPRLRSDAFVSRAVAEWRCGDDATADLNAAARAVAEVRDGALRQAAQADLALTRATIVARVDPQSALDLAGKYISFVQTQQKTIDLPLALLQRARAHRALRNDDAALVDLREGIDLIERRRASIADDDTRDSFLGTHEEVFEELTDMLDHRGETAAAFESVERSRARMLMERLWQPGQTLRQPLHEPEIRQRLSPGTLLIEYLTLPDRVLAFVLTRDGSRLVREQISRDDVRALNRNLVEAIQRGSVDEARYDGAKLYRALLQPLDADIAAASAIAIISDETTAAIPFAALYDSSHSQYLVERLPILYAPSASSFADGERTISSDRGPVFRALVVGDPQLAGDVASGFAELPPLPAARAEAEEIARIYGTSPLLGSAATVTRVRSEAPQCDILHFATHARACRYDPARSSLALTEQPGASDPLTVRRIAALRLIRHPVVILAGCRTAASADRGGTLRNLAVAFIAAGSRNVVGTLWDVDDSAARELSVRFHRELIRGTSPSGSLRAAQLDLLRSNPERFLSTWSAFQVSGIHL